MQYSYKFRIYPDDEQIHSIHCTFGCCRFVYNHFLTRRKDVYAESKATLSYKQCSKELTSLKAELPWLYDADSTALQSSLRALDNAYNNFFDRCKKNIKPRGYPTYKKKHSQRQSCQIKNNHNIFVADAKHIRIPKLGLVRCAISKEVRGRILSATISQSPSGKYFVALCCDDVEYTPAPKTGDVVGLDLGIKNIITASDGTKYANIKHLHKAEKRLIRLQRSLSRKSNGSKNYNKARIKYAVLHEKIANRRNDDLHKLTTYLIRTYDVVCIEDLDVKSMQTSHRIAKLLPDVSFGDFRRMLEYKAAWNNKIVSTVDRYYPSSQLCSDCGYKNEVVKDLSVRAWVCPSCGAVHDRDINAAHNILNEGLRLLA